MIWGFSQIILTVDLHWTPCFESFTCTRLQVPLDYANSSAGTISVAFIKHADPNASAKTHDILYNPGGPGDTGVGELISNVVNLRNFLGDKHNIVSFDPRGVTNSGPNIDCFPGDQADEYIFISTYIPVYALAGAYGVWCSAAHMNNSAQYVGTSAGAQDMLRYIDVSHNSSNSVRKLWYYGVSCGTALGSTFASLHPDRVGRMTLDGVLDLNDWYSGELKANIIHADEIIENFFLSCYKAGKEKCVFYADSPRKIEQRLNDLFEAIRVEPIAVADRSKVKSPTIITYEVMRFALLNACYAPQFQWPQLAQQLLDLENRNGSSMARLAVLFHGPFEGSTVLCADSNSRYNLFTLESFTQHVDLMKSQSHWVGESWLHPVECRQLQITPPPSQQFSFDTTTAVRTSFPILLVSNNLDPVTPLVRARKMHAHFSGLALLVQDSMGHASDSAPSNCSARYVQEYLDGMPPLPGTTCQPNTLPFEYAD
ncbi:alpha/beta-hydrolase [Clathrospora elynae]|uniref:Alpha/beta-hydrolase n=1 Tax=Clathrospora elynae TaxID=706981 RepID=A0A6A5SBG3_9PLEO|nr:alpha/beta-hydrolase [Clathrospora elynae]